MELFEDMHLSHMNYVDYTILSILSLSVILAIHKGFIASILSLTGWIASISLTYKFAPTMRELLAGSFKSGPVLIIITYTGVLLFFLILFAIINSMLSSYVITIKGGFFDRAIGALFGLFRGALIISFIFMCINFSVFFLAAEDKNEQDETIPKDIRDAQLYTPLKIGNNILLDFIPDELDNKIKTATKGLVDSQTQFIKDMMSKIYDELSEEDIANIQKEVGNNKDLKYKARIVLDYYNGHENQATEINKKDLMKLESILGYNK
jgi:membrane protein required for colicin V production